MALHSNRGNISASCLLLTVSFALVLTGCQQGKSRMRMGVFFGNPAGLNFSDPDNLGKHSYSFKMGESNGMLYTCYGGFIDLAHVREGADRTAYITKLTFQKLAANSTKFNFNNIEPSEYYITIKYPPNWAKLPANEKKRIAQKVAITVGQYVGHKSLIWHEIITWHGFATTGVFSDKISAFSPEDSYSDVLGTRIAAIALRDDKYNYDDAITLLLDQILQELNVQSPDVAREAAKKVHGDWYTGGFYFFVNMKKFNFDVGYDDGYLSPILVDGICPGAVPRLYPAPNLDALKLYGFKVDIEIDPKILEKRKIYNRIGLSGDDRVIPEIHFPKIIESLKAEVQTTASILEQEKTSGY